MIRTLCTDYGGRREFLRFGVTKWDVRAAHALHSQSLHSIFTAVCAGCAVVSTSTNVGGKEARDVSALDSSTSPEQDENTTLILQFFFLACEVVLEPTSG